MTDPVPSTKGLWPWLRKPLQIQVQVNLRDWSTPYIRVGCFNGVRFIAVQILFLVIGVSWS